MLLTSYTDYALQVLIYLALHGERLVTMAEMAAAYQLSKNHLMKIVHHLGQNGFIETVRGRGGGLRLGQPPNGCPWGTLCGRWNPTSTSSNALTRQRIAVR